MTDETTPAAVAGPEAGTSGQPRAADDDTLTRTEAGDDAAPAAEVSTEPADIRFEDMGLKPEILQSLVDMGYERPMDVQVAVFEKMMAGGDLMVQARTGTGKTAAFGIPIAQKVPAEQPGAQVLILAPTRELALQVAHELQQITKHIVGLRVVPIYGGAPMKKQVDELADGAQIVAGTPGRVLDHIRRKTLKTKSIRMLVLDECDEMLSMGFQEEIDAIIDTLPVKSERQTLLFSATIPDAIQRIARRNMREPETISLSTGGISVDEIEHYYYLVSGMGRTRDLLKVMKAERPESAIVFCNTREDTNTVAKFLSRQGYNAQAISSDLSQSDRERVMRETREQKIKFLVATDIAARGIDISDLSHVINYTFPDSPEVYVHRTGRTGRAGKRGVAISLVGPREIGSFYYLKLIYKLRPEERELPSAEELATMQEGERYEQVVGMVPEQPSEEYLSLARRVWQSVEGERVVGALLQRLFSEPVQARGERGRRARRERSRDRGEAEAGSADAAPEKPRRRRSEGDDDRPRRSRRRDEDAEAAPRRSRRRPKDDEDAAEVAPRRSRRRSKDDEDAAEAAPRTSRRRPKGDEDAAEAAPRTSRRGPKDDEDAAGAAPRTSRRGPKDDEDAAERGDAAAEDQAARAEGDTAEANGRDADRSEGESGGRRRRRRRRRRPEGDRAASGENGTSDRPIHRPLDTSSDSGQPKEFWEAWADEKQERPDPSEPESPDLEITTRLYVNLGKRESVTADEVRELLAEGLSADAAARIGSIALRNTHCYVRVPEELAEQVIESADGKSYKDRDVVVERARR